jgi:hypothetical protein
VVAIDGYAVGNGATDAAIYVGGIADFFERRKNQRMVGYNDVAILLDGFL